MLYRFLLPFGILLCKLLFRLHATGKEAFPKEGGVLLVSNHVSYLDPVVLGIAAPRPLYFFAKSTLFKNRFFAALIRSLHAFPVTLGKHDKGAITQAIQELGAGKCVLMFPEGTRSRDGTLREGHSGAALIATRANVPILPVYVRGTREALPRGGRFIRPKKVSVHFGAPLFFKAPEILSETMSHQTYYKDITSKIMAAIQGIKNLTE